MLVLSNECISQLGQESDKIGVKNKVSLRFSILDRLRFRLVIKSWLMFTESTGPKPNSKTPILVISFETPLKTGIKIDGYTFNKSILELTWKKEKKAKEKKS